MSNIHHSVPKVGNWYDSANFHESFVVIDCDPEDYIEIQYKDGEIDKIDFDVWYAFNPHEIAEPEEPLAPYGLEQHDDDIISLLNEIEGQDDLEEHLRNLDHDESDWQ
jgi:hypothetical protein